MAVPIIEKYVVMRMRAHTKKHQSALAAAPNTDTEAGQQAYWDSFNADRKRSEKWFETEKEKIEGDPNMNYRDRATEIVKLADRRVYPAWSGIEFGVDCGKPKPECQHSECGFLRTHVGNAAASKKAFAGNQAQVSAELLKLEGPDWHTTRMGQPADIAMSAWDRTLLAALTDPQDGSVPVPALVASAVPLSASEAPAPAPNPLAKIIQEDDPRYRAMMGVLKKTCSFCGEIRKSPHARNLHEKACNENPDRAPLNPRKAAESVPTASEEASEEIAEESLVAAVPEPIEPVAGTHEPVLGTHESVPGSEKPVGVA